MLGVRPWLSAELAATEQEALLGSEFYARGRGTLGLRV